MDDENRNDFRQVPGEAIAERARPCVGRRVVRDERFSLVFPRRRRLSW
jgi:hypothetical protein